MIEVISRNQEKAFNEPKYGLKVAASVKSITTIDKVNLNWFLLFQIFGLLNGVAYLMSTIFALGFLREWLDILPKPV